LNVIVDTSVWSFGLRREDRRLNPHQQAAVKELRELIGEARVRVVGFVRQELLSGVKNAAQFEKLQTFLRAFPDVPLETADYEAAAEASNTCRRQGVTVSVVDALIASTAIARGWSVFTLDTDFEHLSRVLPLKLHSIRR
jgi:predicted nucleic acid-binding protein